MTSKKNCDHSVRYLICGQTYVFAFSSAILFAQWTNVCKRQGKAVPVHAMEEHLHSFYTSELDGVDEEEEVEEKNEEKRRGRRRKGRRRWIRRKRKGAGEGE